MPSSINPPIKEIFEWCGGEASTPLVALQDVLRRDLDAIWHS